MVYEHTIVNFCFGDDGSNLHTIELDNFAYKPWWALWSH